jgi:hypothetical protein
MERQRGHRLLVPSAPKRAYTWKGQTGGVRANVSRLAMQCPVCAGHQARFAPATGRESTRRGCSAIFLMACVLAFAPDPASARTFGGYECTDDCVGHAAGYRWAEMNAITDADDCPEQLSDEFYEGCLAYVDDPDRGADVDDDGRPIRATKRASN